MPFTQNNKYKIFSWSTEIEINDDCIEKLKEIDSYRYFIWSYRAPIWVPIIILASLLSGIINYFIYENFIHLKQIAVQLIIILYVGASLFYYYKLHKAINCKRV